jgi:hypothetical protein
MGLGKKCWWDCVPNPLHSSALFEGGKNAQGTKTKSRHQNLVPAGDCAVGLSLS